MGRGTMRLAALAGVLAFFALVSGARAATAAQFDAGASAVTTNPAYPVDMAGYGGGAAGSTLARRVNALTGKPADLTTRAIAIRSGSR